MSKSTDRPARRRLKKICMIFGAMGACTMCYKFRDGACVGYEKIRLLLDTPLSEEDVKRILKEAKA